MKTLRFSLLWIISFGASAQLPPSPELQQNLVQAERDAQRLHIGQERSRLESAFTAEEIACYKKFFTNACINDLKPRHREAMADLKRQEISLNDTERRLKGEEELLKIEEKSSQAKQQEDVARRKKAEEDLAIRIERGEQKAQSRAAADAGRADEVAKSAQRLKSGQEKASARANANAQAVENAEKYRQKQEQARQRRAEHERQQREKGKPIGKPLQAPL